MLKTLFNSKAEDICPNCGKVCAINDVLCPNCGKNLDELFEQLPDVEAPSFRLIKFIKGLFVILIGIFISIATAALAVSILLTYGSIYDSGSFIQWRSLGSPPEKATQLLGICGYDYAVCLQTDSPKIYVYLTYDCNESAQSCWKQVEQPVIEEPHLESCWFKFAEKNPPKHTVQIIKTNECGSGGAIQTNYALLADGSVWIWQHTVSDLVGMSWFVYAVPVALISFIIGVVIASICTSILWKKMDNDDTIKAA